MRVACPLILLLSASMTQAQNTIEYVDLGDHMEVRQSQGPTLGYHPESGVKIIERDGFAFKSFDGCDTLLPFEMPASMQAIEEHCEDLPHDIVPYTDADGNTYGFAFGLDFNGPISDSRTERYKIR